MIKPIFKNLLLVINLICFLIHPMAVYPQDTSLSNEGRLLPKIYYSTSTKKNVEINEKQIANIIKILDSQKNGDTEAVVSLMSQSKLTINQLEIYLSDIIYAIIDLNLQRAARFFNETKLNKYTNPDYNIGIDRNEVKEMQFKLSHSIEVAYSDRGAIRQYAKNRRLIEKYEKELWDRVWPLYSEEQKRGGYKIERGK